MSKAANVFPKSKSKRSPIRTSPNRLKKIRLDNDGSFSMESNISSISDRFSEFPSYRASPMFSGLIISNDGNSPSSRNDSQFTRDDWACPESLDRRPVMQPRFRRTLFPDPPKVTPSSAATIDYNHTLIGHRPVGQVCIDYEHGTDIKVRPLIKYSPISNDDEALKIDCDQPSPVAESSVNDSTTSYPLSEEFYYRLTVDSMNQHDKSFEHSIWDYDPKFTWDYLPGTHRGQNAPKGFVYGRDFYQEETQWKRHRPCTEQIYTHEINERKAMLEKGESLYDDESDKPISVRPVSLVDTTGAIFNRFEEEIGFPEDGMRDDFCVVCDIAFESVMDSIEHYEGTSHADGLRKHFVDGLLKMGIIESRYKISDHLDNSIIKRGLKKYKTKPEQWLCELCDVPLSSRVMAEAHFNGVAHQKRKKMMKNALRF